ncbi:MAG: alpha/beta hydrolase [Candidatus Zixiibacteriota bacterium]
MAMLQDCRLAVLWIVILAVALSGGCAFAPPTPTPDAVAPTPTAAPAVAAAPAPRLTAPSPTVEAAVVSDTVGRLEVVTLSATSLTGNLLGDPIERSLAIYLPPSYGHSQMRYPVVYFLTGFGDQVTDFISGAHGFAMPLSLDSLIKRQRIREMIFVVVSGRNSLGGSFYVNSPVTGRWEDFVVKDIVPYVDRHYRTLTHARSRGICGHSMGGSGALNLAMRHPDLFGAVYSLSPGLFAEDGLTQSQMFGSPGAIDSFLTFQSALASVPDAEVPRAFGEAMREASARRDWTFIFTCAYGAAFAPAPKNRLPHLAYPYRRVDGQAVRIPEIWAKWEQGFGGLPGRIEKHRGDWRRMKAIVIDYGTQDEYPWIPKGCEYFSRLLDAAGIAHQSVTFAGGHEDHLGERMQEYMLPFLSDVLEPGDRGVVLDSGDN